jgi:hypothetical protein
MKTNIHKLVLVLAGGNYKWDRQEIACRETWANPLYYETNTKVYFVRANTDPCAYDMRMQDINSQSTDPLAATPNWKQYMRSKTVKELLSSSVTVDHNTRTIFVDVPDGIKHGLIKLSLAMREMSNHYTWNYLTRPNTGSYVNLNLLDLYLEKLPKKGLVFGPAGFNKTYWYASGSCSTFTSDVTDLFIENCEEMIEMQWETGGYEDNIYGIYTSKFGFPVVGSPKIDIDYQTATSGSSWFDPRVFHYYFLHTKDDRPHHIVHKHFYGKEIA